MTLFIDPKTLKSWLHDGGEIALLDVREHGQYGEAHLFYGIPLPFSRLEIDAPRLVPRRGVIRVRLLAFPRHGVWLVKCRSTVCALWR